MGRENHEPKPPLHRRVGLWLGLAVLFLFMSPVAIILVFVFFLSGGASDASGCIDPAFQYQPEVVRWSSTIQQAFLTRDNAGLETDPIIKQGLYPFIWIESGGDEFAIRTEPDGVERGLFGLSEDEFTKYLEEYAEAGIEISNIYDPLENTLVALAIFQEAIEENARHLHTNTEAGRLSLLVIHDQSPDYVWDQVEHLENLNPEAKDSIGLTEEVRSFYAAWVAMVDGQRPQSAWIKAQDDPEFVDDNIDTMISWLRASGELSDRFVGSLDCSPGAIVVGPGGFAFPLAVTKEQFDALSVPGLTNIECTNPPTHDVCHGGRYWAADLGGRPYVTPVVAAKGGIVVSGGVGSFFDVEFCFTTEGYEFNVPKITIEDDEGYRYYYTHLGPKTMVHKVGDRVEAGTIIGRVGPTECAQGTTPHLHFDIKLPADGSNPNGWTWKYFKTGTRRGNLVDPMPMLKLAYELLPSQEVPEEPAVSSE